MKSVRFITTVAAGVLAAASFGSPSSAQAPEGTVYVFHSSKTGTCPALDWHVMVGANNALTGMIAWDDMKAMAQATGSIGANQTFTMTAKEMGGQGRTATVTGKVSSGWLNADIKGPNFECKNIQVQVWRPGPPSQ